MRIHRMRIKICLIGDRGVGKTSLIRKYVEGKFQTDESATLGAKMYPVDVDVPLNGGDLVKAKVALFDLMGEHAMRENFQDAIFYGTHGALAVCDLSRPKTLYSLPDWVGAVNRVTGGVPVSIVFNKSDLGRKIEIGPEESLWVRDHYPDVPTHLTSARTGERVEDTFNGIIARAVTAILDARKKTQASQALRKRILGAIAQRDAHGMSKGEVIEAFKGTDAKLVMEELDNLVQMQLLSGDEVGAGAFAATDSLPITFRFQVTPAGRKAAAESSDLDQVIDEAT